MYQTLAVLNAKGLTTKMMYVGDNRYVVNVMKGILPTSRTSAERTKDIQIVMQIILLSQDHVINYFKKEKEIMTINIAFLEAKKIVVVYMKPQSYAIANQNKSNKKAESTH